ncbi:MAG: protoporphyrinogen oxidase [Bacteroidetes bacterium SW_9_63_38]|nr:MAG: protoporphyrinogen oxidase [Bacteroidetes bacterium SW_9_63_38]
MTRVGVLGAGISGLTAAYRLTQSDMAINVQVLEAADRPGGVIRSDAVDDRLVEAGPNTLRPSPLLETLIDDLNLEPERVWANDDASRRYIVRDGTPVSLPISVGDFLTTNLFSTTAKLRLLGEPFIGRGDADDESLAAFARRRLGPEVLNYAVAPFVGGVFAGDPEQLSARHAFDKLVQLEKEHGSLFWGALRSSGGDDETPSGLYSFRDGAEALPGALVDALGDRIAYDTSVSAIRREETRWTVETEHDTGTQTGAFDALICTLPLHALSSIDVDTGVDCAPLRDVEYPPVHVVALGYERSAVAHPLDGFGMLVPPVEDDFDILGTLFSSTLFANRAPDGTALLTTFVGGARDPALARREADAIQSVVERDLAALLGISGSPSFRHHVHWPRAIPQYTTGYGAVKDTIDALEAEHSGLHFAGNYRQGVSVGDAAASGADAAARVQNTL